jgi:MoaA/NifB/PqqE/SkfB family radical SAM enzyme
MTDIDPINRERAAHEKRRWVRLTWTCNNRCLFCLDSDVQSGEIRPAAEIRKEILQGIEESCQRLILSGGEPTIHPEFIEFVSLGRDVGYDWIQAVTNGRMFAYRPFAFKAASAGLNEVTFSMHAHTPALHDELVGVEGAFGQSLSGMDNLVAAGVVVNVDIVINAKNAPHLTDIVKYFTKRGIGEFDLLWMVPFGRAWENRKELFPNPTRALPELREAINLAREAGAVVWTNRLPPRLLEGQEEFIQDPHKIHDEVRGRRQEFRRLLDYGEVLRCKDEERCPQCFLHDYCTELERVVNAVREEGLPAADLDSARTGRVASKDPRMLEALAAEPQGEIKVILDAESARWAAEHADRIKRQPGRYFFSLRPFLTVSELVREGVDPARALKPLAGSRVGLLNLPVCLLPSGRLVSEEIVLPASAMDSAGKVDLDGFTEDFILQRYRVYATRCESCTERPGCPGMPINYIRAFGFALLSPISCQKSSEIGNP